ncbi:hypothetical protein LWI28_000017 [Acer negundo]|uniref:Malic enzyme n=1 Tax=Acer negundo TaxID=4023 RepID=A0AAD5J250_ACENE|nr:hypothetical protein LWI28_000017 [Acer negundo]
MTERDRLDLRGLLPPNVLSSDQQIERFNLGLQEHRLDGDEYVAIVDEFMEAVFTRWPHVIVQFEDFQSKWAFKLLQRYRNTYRMFNDDVQGTAGVAIAGLLGAVRAQGRPMIDFPKQKIVVAGAGSAGIGVLNAARKTMARMLGNNESAFDSARSQFWVVDAEGLITDEREDIDPDALPFARKVKEVGRQGLGEEQVLLKCVGLGTLLSGSSIVSDGMLQVAAECIRDITKQVAAAVVKEAIEEDLAEGYREMDARELKRLNKEGIEEYVQNNMWSPEYPTLVYRKE